jgi:uncharacterized protein with HEPN domain
MPAKDDRARVKDMLDHARMLAGIVSGLEWEEFLADARNYLAAERLLHIIGEAARHVSPELMARHPEIPWGSLIGQRNVLAHEYGDIKLERVFAASSQRLPELITQLQSLLKELA